MQYKTELLAPAKNKETAFAAIDCGADAVYIGSVSYGARQSAANSIEDIKEVVDYAHKFWAKVFVTVNTILSDKELEGAVELVKNLDEIGVDSVLVQDMGLLKRLIELVNNGELTIPIHMSTQCDNRDIEKIAFFNKLGVSRVVLARELSLDKIKEIHKKNPTLELEAFVHGALCVSYSGQCYLSQYIGGRSANRGECAQPCRKKYTVLDDQNNIIAEDIYPLCLKDFNASNYLKEMIDSGIYSFKIEGRLKDITYVKNLVAYYRQELDKYSKKTSSGKSSYKFIPNPNKSFNRGFTSYFLSGREDCYSLYSPKSRGEYLGKIDKVNTDGSFVINTREKVHKQDGLFLMSNREQLGFLVNNFADNKIYPNKHINLKTGMKVYRNNDVEFEKMLSEPTKRQIGVNIEYKAGKLFITDEDNVKIELAILQTEIAKNQQKMNENFVKQFSKTGESDFYVNSIKILSDIPFFPISEINKLRREAFTLLMERRLKEYKREVQNPLSLTKYYKKEVDYRANVHNKTAKEFYEACECEVLEPSLESKLPTGQIELMRTKHCIKYALNMCKSPNNLKLKDEFGKIYPLKFDCQLCEMAVLKPIN